MCSACDMADISRPAIAGRDLRSSIQTQLSLTNLLYLQHADDDTPCCSIRPTHNGLFTEWVAIGNKHALVPKSRALQSFRSPCIEIIFA